MLRSLPDLALWLALAAVVAATLAVWRWLVRRTYRLGRPRPERTMVRCADGWEIAVYRRPAGRRRWVQPVVLCHGLASNRRNFDFEPPYSVSHFLADAGFDCFVVEWRGTRGSRRPPAGRNGAAFCVDDHIDQDGPALLGHALAETGASSAFWIGHSMGGLVGYGVAQGPGAALLDGLVTLGSPVSFERTWLMRTAMGAGALLAAPYAFRYELVATILAPFVGWVRLPFSDVIANTRHIAPSVQRQLVVTLLSAMGRKTLLQFRDWVTTGTFRSFDGERDYREGLGTITTPILCAGGSCDRLAPPPSVTLAHELAGSSDKSLVIFGRERGDGEDYGHGDLVFGRGAPTEVYPVIRAWLEERATPL
ncbi:MAG: alpha/beta fold hydrolase [Deltaproteobacteria bacterium]|nr:alpha/beta fold hydrolase [Deltaproteobacteria bacterium]